MKYFIDTEFIEDGKTIDLISVGIVCEDGREYYAVSTEFNSRKASAWVRDNVLVHLPSREERVWKDRAAIRLDVVAFVLYEPNKLEFWGYYADYDWVVLCQLFGAMMDLPKEWPMYCRDIKQWCDMLGNPKLPEQGKGEHNAIADARWNRQAWEFLRAYEATGAVAYLPEDQP